MTSIAAMAVAIWALHAEAPADEIVQREMKQDMVLRALVDELERGKAGLKLEDLQRPYFIEYGLVDAAVAWVSADLGAVARRDESRSRRLRTGVRVGSYELDNTNFSGGGYGYGGWGGVSIPIEDDYNAIRQAIWWATDRQYKEAAETFVKKKAFMESKMIEDKPDDFSREPPAVYFEERLPVAIDTAPLEQLAVALSAIFRDYPDIKNSNVRVEGVLGNKYLVNTEGTRLRTTGSRFSLHVSATVQVDDGMELSDSISLHGEKLADLPAGDELSQRCRKMITQLLATKQAPALESYTGPVLFEAEPATTVFARQFAGRFAGGQRPVGSRTSPDDFENKLDKRVLARFLDVVDDPTRETIAGTQVLGHYAYDDQGVKARPVTLVEQGRLKTLLMSRNPSKTFKNSTGHGRGAYGPTASTGCLSVTATDGSDAATLTEELLEACEDEGLEYGIRIAALGSIGGGFSRGGGSAPLVMYKVYPDGREELVRGAEIAQVDLKAFKRVLAAGDTPFVRNSGGWGGSTTVSAPAMLFEELDLAKVDRDFDKPPILPSPLARQRDDTTE
ncbi:MAG: hypothetical protein JSV19_06740 [Phycisphaerales bacterium]|nr:MAG: hypothetical protein JSV19_06740 [Phycisphaerales bacterium]